MYKSFLSLSVLFLITSTHIPLCAADEGTKALEFLAACIDATIVPVAKSATPVVEIAANPYSPFSWMKAAVGIYSMGSMVYTGGKYIYNKTMVTDETVTQEIGQQPEPTPIKNLNDDAIEALEKIDGFNSKDLHILALLEKTKTPEHTFFRDRYKTALEREGIEVLPSDMDILTNKTRTIKRSGMMSCNISSKEFGRLKYDKSSSDSDSDNDSGNMSAASSDDEGDSFITTMPASPRSKFSSYVSSPELSRKSLSNLRKFDNDTIASPPLLVPIIKSNGDESNEIYIPMIKARINAHSFPMN